MLSLSELRLGIAAVDAGLLDGDQLVALALEAHASDGRDALVHALVARQLLSEADCARLSETLVGQCAPATLAEGRPTLAALEEAGGDLQEETRRLLALGTSAEHFQERYTVGDLIGRGGAGTVLEAVDHLTGRTVALKTINLREADPAVVWRFLTEARVTAQLQHPHVMPVHDVGTLPGGSPYYTMKFVRGRSLRDRLDGDAELGRFQALSLFQKVCLAVDFANSRGVVHRDLKPDNILLGDFGEVLVTDWGIARQIGRPTSPATVPETPAVTGVDWVTTGSGTSQLTCEGAVLGTPGYMAPEQTRGDLAALDARTDVWALGAILYELLCDERLLVAPNVFALMVATVSGDYPTPRRRTPDREIPEELDAICMKALAVDPEARFQTAGALHDAIEAWLADIRERRQRTEAAERLVGSAGGRLEEARRLEVELNQARGALTGLVPSSSESRPAKLRRWAAEDEVDRIARARVETLAAVEGELARALELVPEQVEARRSLARLYWDRYRAARDALDVDAAAQHLRFVSRYDDGAFAERLAAEVPLRLRTTPPGAEVVLYEYRERDRILVPDAPRPLGRTPLNTRIPTGRQLLVVTAPGRPPARVPLLVWNGDEIELDVAIPMADELGEGFVYVPAGDFVRGNDPDAVLPSRSGRMWVDGFAISRFPVTTAEYAAFLDDLDPAEARRRVPRDRSTAYWEPDASGRWVLPYQDAQGDVWQSEWPVVAVTQHDARAYAEWRSLRDGRSHRLPTADEWEKAARGADGRKFPWGDHFDPTFCHTRESHGNSPRPASVGACPLDESPYGVRDMAGGARDWTITWIRPDLIAVCGGSWNLFDFFCRAASRYPNEPGTPLASVGFRLVRPLDLLG